jgi:hypothetical protein
MPSSKRHVRSNRNYKYSSLVLDRGSRQRLEDRFVASGKLSEGEALTEREKRQLSTYVSKHISYNSIGDASIIGMHWNAVKAYIHDGDTSMLDSLVSEYGDEEGRLIVRYGKDEKKRVILETNLRQLQTCADFGLFEEGQELDLEQVMSSNWAL